MLPARPLLHQCPNCNYFLKKRNITSGNTFGGLLYSDGKIEAPMLPELVIITKCKNCNHIFWLDEKTEDENFEWEKYSLVWDSAFDADFLSIEECFEALELKVQRDQEDEVYLRQEIWWNFNDRVRNEKDLFESELDNINYSLNVQRLIEILEVEDDNERLLLADLYRSIGEFEKCINTLEGVENTELYWIKDKMINECKKRNQSVILLMPDLNIKD